MRIVGGQWRGRGLRAPETAAIRPTADRLRESLFNILAHTPWLEGRDPVRDARVLDLFAGTGALGLEALSRGAHYALFVDNGEEARALIRANVEALGAGGRSRILRRDAAQLGPMPPQTPFTLVFMDPPYGQGLVEPTLAGLVEGGWLAERALVLIEEAAAVAAALTVPPGYRLLDRRVQAESALMFLEACTNGDAL